MLAQTSHLSPRTLLHVRWSAQWVILMAPTKYPLTITDTVSSRMLESVREDVECFFGILKGCFRILKLHIGYHNKEAIDYALLTW